MSSNVHRVILVHQEAEGCLASKALQVKTVMMESQEWTERKVKEEHQDQEVSVNIR